MKSSNHYPSECRKMACFTQLVELQTMLLLRYKLTFSTKNGKHIKCSVDTQRKQDFKGQL